MLERVLSGQAILSDMSASEPGVQLPSAWIIGATSSCIKDGDLASLLAKLVTFQNGQIEETRQSEQSEGHIHYRSGGLQI